MPRWRFASSSINPKGLAWSPPRSAGIAPRSSTLRVSPATNAFTRALAAFTAASAFACARFPGTAPPAAITGSAALRADFESAAIDGAALFARARLPARQDRIWRVELAPLTRMQAWNIAEITDGERIAVIGFEPAEPRATALARAEYLFVGSAIYGLRSSPAGG